MTTKNNVCYTCIIGEYDNLKDPEIVSDNFDYICFTDTQINSNVWKILPIPNFVDDLNISNVKKQRIIKWRPDLLFQEYENSIWVDANILIKCDLNQFIKEDILTTVKHPVRQDIYEEGLELIRLKLDSPKTINSQLNKYRKLGFPKKSGLAETGFIIRKHTDSRIKELGEKMEQELLNFSHRDQLSFNYVISTIQNLNVKYLDKYIIRKSPYFKLEKHKRKRLKYEL